MLARELGFGARLTATRMGDDDDDDDDGTDAPDESARVEGTDDRGTMGASDGADSSATLVIAAVAELGLTPSSGHCVGGAVSFGPHSVSANAEGEAISMGGEVGDCVAAWSSGERGGAGCFCANVAPMPRLPMLLLLPARGTLMARPVGPLSTAPAATLRATSCDELVW